MKTHKIWTTTAAILLYLCAGISNAQTNNQINNVVDNSQTFGDYEINYSTFNSQFVSAEIANIHGLVRAKDQALINISVIHKKTGKTLQADLSGTAKNLIQQSKTIEFKTIKEPGAIYYIGALRHSNEEVFHFNINVLIEGKPHTVKFIRKLYTEP